MTMRPFASCSLAAGIVAGVLWLAPGSARVAELRADPPGPDQDTDDDFLPDQLEWACLTSATMPDTDLDGTPDFIEVVQRGNPRSPGSPLPADHEMRVVATASPGASGSEVTLHLLFRFMGDVSLLNSLAVWAEVGMAPGLHIPLESLALGPISVAQRLVPGEGLWVRVSAVIASEAVLDAVLPCVLTADAVIGTRHIVTGVSIIDRGGVPSSLIPCAPNLFAVQSIRPFSVSSSQVNNRICVLQLTPVGEGGGGNAFEVTGAECQDCNDLVCGVDCTNSLGTVLILPSGSGSITGG